MIINILINVENFWFSWKGKNKGVKNLEQPGFYALILPQITGTPSVLLKKFQKRASVYPPWEKVETRIDKNGFGGKKWKWSFIMVSTAAAPRKICSDSQAKSIKVQRTVRLCCGALHLHQYLDICCYKSYAALPLSNQLH